MLTFEEKLTRYADLIVKVGLNLQKGQRLFITAVSLDTAPLVRKVAERAYQNGCPYVSVAWIDEGTDRIRFENAPRDSFEEYPLWIRDGMLTYLENGDAIVRIDGKNPELLNGIDSELLAIAGRSVSKNYKPVSQQVSKNASQWLVVCPPTPDWATKVFPDETTEGAMARLWDAVFQTCRVEHDDPIAFWQQQSDHLHQRRSYLNTKKYHALHFTAPGTDLTVGLPSGHIWAGGGGKTIKDIAFTPNLPTEEVFTIPHKDRINGTVTATKPLSFRGSLIDNFKLTFVDGKVVDFSAEKGEDTLRDLLDTDDNARSLGEVALIPHKTPISQMGFVFLNTLYDENAANHLALGNAYRFNLAGSQDMTDEEFAAAGGNDSLVHVDFMFGSGEMDVDGVYEDGTTEPVMRAGEWAFDV